MNKEITLERKDNKPWTYNGLLSVNADLSDEDIESLSFLIEDVGNRAYEQGQQSRWINVKDKLPPKLKDGDFEYDVSKDYLVITDGIEQYAKYDYKHKQWRNAYNHYSIGGVTHWLAGVKPPKDGELIE